MPASAPSSSREQRLAPDRPLGARRRKPGGQQVMKPTRMAVLATLLALPGCANTPRLIGWSCGSAQQGATLTVSSMRTLGPTGRPLSASHSWYWHGPQGAVQLTIGQDAADRWDAAGEELVTISVGLEDEGGRTVRWVERRAGATDATTVLTARRSSRVLYGFRPSLAL